MHCESEHAQYFGGSRTASRRPKQSTGLLIGGCGTEGRVIKLIPPLTISDEDLKQGLGLLERALQTVMEPA